ncbi:ABC transporter ATP-binding protein [Paenibacillus mesophilus]|uniref:ATP-binding cassette domain-containing protein n=1 Tax=Paenibacillus mesophilus TaxID=2582849 RepID=UPI00110ED1E6|nr:ABC transporter ATP-binding protein [Paenibacillus mesophilus]TMV51622.1 ABC transporter ATP-binding protein [Paenibacillus mesophilus]
MYRAERKPVVVLLAALLLGLPVLPIELWLVKSLVDRVQAWTAQEPIGPILAAAAWLALLMAANNIALGVPVPMAQTRLNEIGTLEGQRIVLRKTGRLPLAAIESPAVQNLRERALQFSLYETFNIGAQLTQSFLRAAILLAIMLAYGGWIPAAAFCASAWLVSTVSGRSAESLEKLLRAQTPDRRLLAYYAGLMTGRDAAKEIRLFGLGGLLADRWSSLADRQSEETRKAVRSSELRKIGPELLLALVGGLLVALLVLLPGANKLSAGDFSVLFLSVTMLVSQLPGIIADGATLRRQSMKWEDFRAYTALEEEGELPDRDERPGGSEAVSLQGDSDIGRASGMLLQVRGLRFRYPGADGDSVNGVSLEIPHGCRAALVGENGSGKSTLVKLLAGLYTPSGGEVVWRRDAEGRQTCGRPGAADGSAVSAVFQDFAKLYVTLRENVALGKLSAIRNDPDMQAALLDAGSKLRDLDMQLGAPFGGLEPSGGEWQKIVTARALLRDADFVFFDEPTAALDPQAEKDAFELFMRVTAGRSALLVTHRLGAAKLADRLFVLKDGRITEQGTHDELMRLGGEYSRMFRMQALWYE